MGILDEAIKEHLELKRQHGAGESELQKLEDEAFGAAERPGDEEASDALAEAPTEFISQPEVSEAGDEEVSPRSRPAPQIADLQEAPPLEPEPPAEEEAPAMEHEAIPEQELGPSTEERHAIAEQPTEMFDVEEVLEEPVDESAEIQVEEVADEHEEADDPDDDFWDEKRLSDELDQALEAPAESEPGSERQAAVEEEPAAEPEAEAASEDAPPRHDEDVLEETPDFLEEAPEDDQLWFEQKPPKDFDFDD